MAEDSPPSSDPSSSSNESTLISMGYSAELVALALKFTEQGPSDGCLMRAVDWLSSDRSILFENYQTLKAMGFDESAIIPCLNKTTNIERAIALLTDTSPSKASSAANALNNSAASSVDMNNLPETPLDKSDKFALHRTVLRRDLPLLIRYCNEIPSLLSVRDSHGHTPLILALRYRYFELVSAMLQRGADSREKTKEGWSLLQEAALSGDRAVTLDIIMHSTLAKQSEWLDQLPILTASLSSTEDFYMEMDWKIESWIPLVSRFCPNDKFCIYKAGNKLRLDCTFRGMTNDKIPQIQRGKMSFVLTGTSVYMIDYDYKFIKDMMREFRTPDYDSMQRTADSLLAAASSSSMARSSLDTSAASFKIRRTLFGSDRHEKIDGRESSVVDINGIQFVQLRQQKKEDDSKKEAATLPTVDEYFDEKSSVAFVSGVNREAKEMTATLWLTDSFPLRLDSLLKILSLLAPMNSNLSALHELLSVNFPSDHANKFPIKLSIPLVAQTNAIVTFSKYQKLNDFMKKNPSSSSSSSSSSSPSSPKAHSSASAAAAAVSDNANEAANGAAASAISADSVARSNYDALFALPKDFREH